MLKEIQTAKLSVERKKGHFKGREFQWEGIPKRAQWWRRL